MKITKCDRCGKEINPLINNFQIMQNPTIYKVLRTDVSGSTTLDICQNCAIDFEDWLKNSYAKKKESEQPVERKNVIEDCWDKYFEGRSCDDCKYNYRNYILSHIKCATCNLSTHDKFKPIIGGK